MVLGDLSFSPCFCRDYERPHRSSQAEDWPNLERLGRQPLPGPYLSKIRVTKFDVYVKRRRPEADGFASTRLRIDLVADGGGASGMYRAPVEEIAFTLKHVAGLKPRSMPALRRPWRRPCRCHPGRSRPLRQRGGGAALQDRRRAGRGAERTPLSPRRLAGRSSTGAGSTAAGTRCPDRPDMAARACRPCSASRRSEMWNAGRHGLRHRPDADHGRGRGARQARQRGAEGADICQSSSPANGWAR